MPEMDGITLIKHVRKMEAYERIPILFLATESQTSRRLESKGGGADGVDHLNPSMYAQKPLSGSK